jgi:putative hemolysin
VASIGLDTILRDKYPVLEAMPSIVRAAAVAIVRRLTRMDEIETLLSSHTHQRGAAFLDDVFEDLDFSCFVSSCDKARVPPEGSLVIVANHPLGAMDGLALLRAILDVRSDAQVVVNKVLMDVSNLAGHLLALDVFSARPRPSDVVAMGRVLEQRSALVIFPSGDVSRLTPTGIRDRSWCRGAAYLAYKYRAPILPVFIGGRNSLVFYIASFFSRTLSILLLPRQIFRQRGKTIPLKIGDPIPAAVFAQPAQIARLRNYVYQLANNTVRPTAFHHGESHAPH